MSGPKVVRIVTRQELIEICEGQIAGLEAAIRRWERVGHRNEVVDGADVLQARQRLSAIRALLADDRFAEVQKQVPSEIAFLAADIERRIAKAADAVALERRSKRRAVSLVESLKQALTARGITVPSAINTPGKHTPEELTNAIAEAFTLLAPDSRSEGMTQRQKDLAAYLGGEEDRQTFAQWVTAGATTSTTPAVAECERIVDELRVLDQRAASTFDDRLGAIQEESREGRLGLLVDSLTLDVSAARKDAIVRAELTMRLAGIAAELTNLGDSAVIAKVTEIEALIDRQADAADLQALLQQSQGALEEARIRKANGHRRTTLLSGLAQLGYEVHEEMETAWVRDGKITLRDRASATYGVEIGGNPDGMVQMRTVAFDRPGAVRVRDDDVKAEESFCDTFAALSADVAAAGGGISIVKAVGVGVTPVKSVAVSADATDESLSSIDNAKTSSRQM